MTRELIYPPDETKVSMDGPSHYRLAEELIHYAANAIRGDEPAQAAMIARAKVHAALATADNLASVYEALRNLPYGSAR
jgi:hypothetical protein